MARSNRRRQQATQKKAEKRKQAARERARGQHVVPDGRLPPAAAARWPVLECVVNADWDTRGALARVVVARRGPGGAIAVALFLMDLGCLGGKNGFAALVTPAKYRAIRDGALRESPASGISLDLAAKIVRDGVDYARSLGFNPHRDVVRARKLIADANPDRCTHAVPLGDGDGRPLYIQGPNDDPAAVLATLRRTVGPYAADHVCGADPRISRTGPRGG